MRRMPIEGKAWTPVKSAVLATSGVLLLLVGALLWLACKVALHDRGMTVDDGFIVFRYAKNLVAGHGFRWNAAGTPSEGFSSTIAMVGIAGLIRVGMDPVLAAIALDLAGAAAMTAGL